MKVTGVDGHTQQLESCAPSVPGDPAISDQDRRHLVSRPDRLRSCPEKRWMHLNGLVFFPDGSDYNQSRRGVECELCFLPHVKAQPGLDG